MKTLLTSRPRPTFASELKPEAPSITQSLVQSIADPVAQVVDKPHARPAVRSAMRAARYSAPVTKLAARPAPRASVSRTSGPSRSPRGRAPFEFYPTPPEATRALLSVEQFDGDIWEPACGDGAISQVLVDAGYSVVSTDLIDRGYGQGGHDFLKSTWALGKHIITNPPYGTHGLGDAFVRRALIHTQKTGGCVAMLLNLRSLANPERTPKFCKTPPAAIYILDDLTCWPEGIPTSSERRIARQQYYWAVWKPGHTGAPKVWWLSTQAFR